jgi:hypothetical protein
MRRLRNRFSSEARVSGPKAFISYSWSSPEHQQWVIDLATQLRESGVDAILDKWDLREGHDSVAFMERMVTDPTVEKVIIISDRVYVEKADGRRGGVGTETQIISAQVYAKANQDKFVAVISEVDAEGKPFVPTYYASRIFINLSSEEIYAENFEALIRWIFNKPAFPKPQIGKPPAYLKEDSVLLPTKSRALRVIDLLQKGSIQSEAALRKYFETLAENFESLRIVGTPDPYDQAVVDSISAFQPYRDEFIRVVTTLARSKPSESSIVMAKRFFESVVRYCYAPRTMTSYLSTWFDNYKFIIHELFLYTSAIILKYELYESFDQFVRGGFYVGNIQEYLNEPIQGIHIFSVSIESLDRRKQRLQLNHLSLQAKLLNDRAKMSGVSFDELMQADFTLFIREASDALKANRQNRWYPDTLVYMRGSDRPFEIFARARSNKYFDKVKHAVGVDDKAGFVTLIEAFGQRLYRPQWHYHNLNPAGLVGIEQIATTN